MHKLSNRPSSCHGACGGMAVILAYIGHLALLILCSCKGQDKNDALDPSNAKRAGVLSPAKIIISREQGFDTPKVPGQKHSRKVHCQEAAAEVKIAGMQLSDPPAAVIAASQPAAPMQAGHPCCIASDSRRQQALSCGSDPAAAAAEPAAGAWAGLALARAARSPILARLSAFYSPQATVATPTARSLFPLAAPPAKMGSASATAVPSHVTGRPGYAASAA